MYRFVLCCALTGFALYAGAATAPTYNAAEVVNLRDQGLPADERATHALVAAGDTVYGATSGHRCHVFRFHPATGTVTVLATLDGPNTVLKGLALDGDTLYVGTMLDGRQLWRIARQSDPTFEPENVNLWPIQPEYGTGHLYRIRDIGGDAPEIEDLGVPVAGQGVHTLAIDPHRQLLYGVTAPNGRFFIYDIKTGSVHDTAFGRTYTNVSNHRVAMAEVERELADLTPGEGEWNNRLIPRAMHVRADGTLYTSGWRGEILKYDPDVADIAQRFSSLGYIPSVPGRQHWNRIDAITERDGLLYMGTSDGYLLRLDPETDAIQNLGKPIRAIETMGLAVSPLDNRIYGVSGGGLEGMSRPWSYDPETGAFEVDLPALPVIKNRRPIGAVTATRGGALVLAEAARIANLHILTPGEPVPWAKSGVLAEMNPQEGSFQPDARDRFTGHTPREVKVYPIPSALHGGSGYTAIQADGDGRIYVGTAYYGETARLVQLDPATAEWRELFRADALTYQFARGYTQGKIHTKLRRGTDGKIYGAMKQGYEFEYVLRPDIGEAPPGHRGSQPTCHFFVYDPEADTTRDLGPGWLQEGITSFDIDIDRGYLYGASVPGVFFLVYDLERGRVWNAGNMGATHPWRYMPCDQSSGKVIHPSEQTPAGRWFMSIWDPEAFQLTDYEVAVPEGFDYRHSYAMCAGPPGSGVIYGAAGGQLFEMDLTPNAEDKLEVRPLCPIDIEGEVAPSMAYAIERGPDGRIYWANTGGNQVPIPLFAWDPATETRTYLGSCALGGEFIDMGHVQGICLDGDGNLALHVLYAHITEDQQKHWSVSEDFHYGDIDKRPHYLGFPAHQKGTFYAVYYLENATAIK